MSRYILAERYAAWACTETITELLSVRIQFVFLP